MGDTYRVPLLLFWQISCVLCCKSFPYHPSHIKFCGVRASFRLLHRAKLSKQSHSWHSRCMPVSSGFRCLPSVFFHFLSPSCFRFVKINVQRYEKKIKHNHQNKALNVFLYQLCQSIVRFFYLMHCFSVIFAKKTI